MSTTRELVAVFEPKLPPDQLQITTVQRSELVDSEDPDAGVRSLPPDILPTPYCWRLDVAGVSYWIGQVDDAKLIAGLKSVLGEGLGEVVGTLAKVRLDGKTLAYGPVEIRDKQWQRLQDAGIVVS